LSSDLYHIFSIKKSNLGQEVEYHALESSRACNPPRKKQKENLVEKRGGAERNRDKDDGLEPESLCQGKGAYDIYNQLVCRVRALLETPDTRISQGRGENIEEREKSRRKKIKAEGRQPLSKPDQAIKKRLVTHPLFSFSQKELLCLLPEGVSEEEREGNFLGGGRMDERRSKWDVWSIRDLELHGQKKRPGERSFNRCHQPRQEALRRLQ